VTRDQPRSKKTADKAPTLNRSQVRALVRPPTLYKTGHSGNGTVAGAHHAVGEAGLRTNDPDRPVGDLNPIDELPHIALTQGRIFGVQTVEEAEAKAPSIIARLHRDLLTECYRPGDVRRVWLPKPGGGQRGLGIPNVADRTVQQAVLQVLEPLYEPHFHPSSHGFRPHRGAHTAIAEATGYLKAGYQTVVDLDFVLRPGFETPG
jgi:Reverse transcriptase (RNA-dependent DNA polymerase)